MCVQLGCGGLNPSSVLALWLDTNWLEAVLANKVACLTVLLVATVVVTVSGPGLGWWGLAVAWGLLVAVTLGPLTIDAFDLARGNSSVGAGESACGSWVGVGSATGSQLAGSSGVGSARGSAGTLGRVAGWEVGPVSVDALGGTTGQGVSSLALDVAGLTVASWLHVVGAVVWLENGTINVGNIGAAVGGDHLADPLFGISVESLLAWGASGALGSGVPVSCAELVGGAPGIVVLDETGEVVVGVGDLALGK